MLRVDHDCEINVKSENIYYLPKRTRLQRLGGLLRQILMASLNNPRAHRYLRNHSAIISERRLHLRKNIHIIHPFSIFRHWWNFMMLINLTASLLLIPYKSAFDMLRSPYGSWTLIKNILLLICSIDVMLNFITGYFSKTQRIVEMNYKMIAKRYILHGTFVTDFFGSLPTDIIFIFNWYNSIVVREFTSMIHILRLFSTRTYIINVAESYDIQRGYFGVFTFIPLSIISLHWLACMTWIIPILKSSVIQEVTVPGASSWTVQENIWDKTIQYRYWLSLMRSIAILTRSGFLSSEPTAPEDQFMAVFVQSLGTLSLCYAVSHAIRLFKAGNSSKLKYQTTVAQLKQYMRYKQLSRSLQSRFLKYYEFRYQQHYFRETEILSSLSSQMRQEIVMHSCRKLVENVAFFNNLPVLLLTRIVSQLKSEIFLTNDIIVRANQPGNCMYFISTGTVAIYTDSGKEVCHLEDGAHFGEIALVMPDEHRVATVIAVEMCELYRLERNDFMRTIYPYPMLWERIKKIAIERHEKTMIIDAR